MQIKEQWKGSKNWKFVTGVATAATLSLGAIAVATPGSDDVPRSIDLNERSVVTQDNSQNQSTFVPLVDFSADDSFASASLSDGVTDDLSGSVMSDILSDSVSVQAESVSAESPSVESVADDSLSAQSISGDSSD